MTKDFLGWPVKIVAGEMRSNAKWIFGPPVSIGEHLVSTERDAPKRCGNCTHWGREPAGRHRSVPGFGDCTRVLHHVGEPLEKGFSDGTSIHDEPAVVVDGSGYFAELKTKESFSCCLWEEIAQ